jgi:hypothetical protein
MNFRLSKSQLTDTCSYKFKHKIHYFSLCFCLPVKKKKCILQRYCSPPFSFSRSLLGLLLVRLPTMAEQSSSMANIGFWCLVQSIIPGALPRYIYLYFFINPSVCVYIYVQLNNLYLNFIDVAGFD